ncbi:unnamed protein product [Rotaria magnacalcarata]|uniref:Uncharacterized protein n=2 Tax=Rotaria magnacalcarata TaxID=392030 RepID=A0A816WL87_9BILA|nr:unnamed protein product [Rotaria magnacalcarata]
MKTLNETMHSDARPTLVYTCLGNAAITKHQNYIWRSLEQARRIVEPSLVIVLILSSAEQLREVQPLLQRLNVTPILDEDLYRASNDSFKIISDFRRVFFVQGVMIPHGNTNFNIVTTERLFAIHAYMQATNTSDVFHVENDNMLYMDLVDLTKRMHMCHVYLALARASHSHAVISIAYIRNASTLAHFIRFITDIYRLNRTRAIEHLKTDWINDMTIASRYLELFAGTPERSKSSGIYTLPTQLTKGNCCLCTLGNHEEAIVFDARTLGKYFGGDYWLPNSPFWSKEELVDPRGRLLVWNQTSNDLKIPFVNGIRIVNLHIHSKRLELFSSAGKGQTNGIGK